LEKNFRERQHGKRPKKTGKKGGRRLRLQIAPNFGKRCAVGKVGGIGEGSKNCEKTEQFGLIQVQKVKGGLRQKKKRGGEKKKKELTPGLPGKDRWKKGVKERRRRRGGGGGG